MRTKNIYIVFSIFAFPVIWWLGFSSGARYGLGSSQKNQIKNSSSNPSTAIKHEMAFLDKIEKTLLI